MFSEYSQPCGWMIDPCLIWILRVWPIEVAEQLSEKGIPSSIDGFDITSAHWPHPAWLPDNITLHEHDVFTPFPDSYHEKFNLVQIRAFAAILREDNVDRLLQNVAIIMS